MEDAVERSELRACPFHRVAQRVGVGDVGADVADAAAQRGDGGHPPGDLLVERAAAHPHQAGTDRAGEVPAERRADAARAADDEVDAAGTEGAGGGIGQLRRRDAPDQPPGAAQRGDGFAVRGTALGVQQPRGLLRFERPGTEVDAPHRPVRVFGAVRAGQAQQGGAGGVGCLLRADRHGTVEGHQEPSAAGARRAGQRGEQPEGVERRPLRGRARVTGAGGLAAETEDVDEVVGPRGRGGRGGFAQFRDGRPLRAVQCGEPPGRFAGRRGVGDQDPAVGVLPHGPGVRPCPCPGGVLPQGLVHQWALGRGQRPQRQPGDPGENLSVGVDDPEGDGARPGAHGVGAGGPVHGGEDVHGLGAEGHQEGVAVGLVRRQDGGQLQRSVQQGGMHGGVPVPGRRRQRGQGLVRAVHDVVQDPEGGAVGESGGCEVVVERVGVAVVRAAGGGLGEREVLGLRACRGQTSVGVRLRAVGQGEGAVVREPQPGSRGGPAGFGGQGPQPAQVLTAQRQLVSGAERGAYGRGRGGGGGQRGGSGDDVVGEQPVGVERVAGPVRVSGRACAALRAGPGGGAGAARPAPAVRGGRCSRPVPRLGERVGRQGDPACSAPREQRLPVRVGTAYVGRGRARVVLGRRQPVRPRVRGAVQQAPDALAQRGDGAGGQRGAHREMPASHGEGEGDVPRARPAPGASGGGEGDGGEVLQPAPQLGLRTGGHREGEGAGARALPQRPRCDGWCFRHHQVAVGAAEAEAADGGRAHARGSGQPVHGLGAHPEGTAVQVDPGIGLPEAGGGRLGAVPQRQQDLEQGGDPGRHGGVAHVGLHRSQTAVAGPVGAPAERVGERLDLDGVPERGSGAVRLDVADVVEGQPGTPVHRGDELGLGAGVRRGDAVRAAVAVHSAGADHPVHGVAVGQGAVEALEHDRAHALAEHRAVGRRGERRADAGRRQHAHLAAPHVQFGGEHQRHSPGEGHVALPRADRLAGQVNGDQ